MAALDLLLVVISKMNGESQKLFRICGISLSDKARELVAEKWKSEQGQNRTSLLHPKSTSPSGGNGLYSELPKLTLRDEKKPSQTRTGSPRRRGEVASSATGMTDPFTFSFEPSKDRQDPPPQIAAPKHDSAEYKPTNIEIPTGAAATLRARLQRIREKGSVNDSEAVAGNQESALEPAPQTIDLAQNIQSIRNILNHAKPLSDDDPDLVQSIETLKLFHGALSKQQYSNSPYPLHSILQFRLRMIENTDTIVGLVRQ